jgi:hypothetical protein
MPKCHAKGFSFFMNLTIAFIINVIVEVVRIAGLEPDFAGLPVLLIGAFLCGCLQTVNHTINSVCNIKIAITGSFEKNNLCVFVRRLQVCAETVRKKIRAKSVRNLCGRFRTVSAQKQLKTQAVIAFAGGPGCGQARR